MAWFRRSRTASVSAPDAITLVAEGAAVLDVRENSEWNAGHVPGAVHVPLAQVAAQATRRLPKGRRVVVVCRSGARARTATKTLADLGVDAVLLSGGMRAWESAGGRVVTKGTRPGTVV